MRRPALDPNELERFFVDRANAGDVEGLVAIYEKNAVLAGYRGDVVTGEEQLRQFFRHYLAAAPRLVPSMQTAALQNGDLSLTASRHHDGTASAEIARRQPDGSWLWVVDRFVIG